jgi:hypothetical protein
MSLPEIPESLYAAALRAEIEWLRTAHANSADKGYSSEYRAGFAAAIGWLDLHANMADEGRRDA